MALYRLADIEIIPEQVGAYTKHLATEIEASLKNEPGVLFLFATHDKEKHHLVKVFEGYADKAAYEAHISSEHFLKYKSDTANMIVSLSLKEVDAIALWTQNGPLPLT
jgi:quinol monooxygenase YgiN